jgi:hypothetical protein
MKLSPKCIVLYPNENDLLDKGEKKSTENLSNFVKINDLAGIKILKLNN